MRFGLRFLLLTLLFLAAPTELRAFAPKTRVAVSLQTAIGRMLTETSDGVTHTYAYDLAGNRTKTTYGYENGGTHVLLSSYDVLNRLQALTDGSSVTTYNYNLNGDVRTKALPDGELETTTYNALGRKASSNDVEGNSLIYAYGFGYDAGGNLTLQSEYKAGLLIRSVGMSYYSNDRLQTETVHAGANTSAEQTTSTKYTDDAIGNRTQKAVVGGLTTSYTYSNDELSGWSDTGGNSVSYTYDGNGNRSTRVQAGVTYNYGYDTENRLISLTQAGVTYGYLYDYRTRRVNRTDSGVLARLRLLRI